MYTRFFSRSMAKAERVIPTGCKGESVVGVGNGHE
jgi:hypothetical protein